MHCRDEVEYPRRIYYGNWAGIGWIQWGFNEGLSNDTR